MNSSMEPKQPLSEYQANLEILVQLPLFAGLPLEPLKVLGGLAQKISADENFSTELESPALQAVTVRPDELGNLAHVFRKMATDVYTRTVKLKEQVQQLVIKIDQMRRKEQVAEVVETDFFSDLKKRASELRKRGDEEGNSQGESPS